MSMSEEVGEEAAKGDPATEPPAAGPPAEAEAEAATEAEAADGADASDQPDHAGTDTAGTTSTDTAAVASEASASASASAPADAAPSASAEGTAEVSAEASQPEKMEVDETPPADSKSPPKDGGAAGSGGGDDAATSAVPAAAAGSSTAGDANANAGDADAGDDAQKTAAATTTGTSAGTADDAAETETAAAKSPGASTEPAPPSPAAATTTTTATTASSSAGGGRGGGGGSGSPTPTPSFKPVTAAEAVAMAAAKAKAKKEKEARKKAKRSAKSGGGSGGKDDDGEPPHKKKKLKKKKKSKKSFPEFGPSGRRLPTAATRDPATVLGSTKKSKKHKPSVADAAAAPYSAAQAAVNEMMRKALEEDQYSALGSIVDTDSEDDDIGAATKSTVLVDPATIPAPVAVAGAPPGAVVGGGGGGMPPGGPPGARTSPVPLNLAAGGSTAVRLDRTILQAAMRKRLRIEEQRAASRAITDDSHSSLSGTDDYYEDGDTDDESSGLPGSRGASPTPSDVVGSAGGGRKKKRGSRRGSRPGASDESDDESAGMNAANEGGAGGLGVDDDELMDEFEEGSIFGQTAGGSNATWVECDKCKKWRRLRGVVDAKKLPSKWYCHMNKGDPERAKCSAPEEEYETPATPESMQDQRTRKHLRLWVRRLQCNEAYESRLPTMTTRGKKRSAATSAKEPYEWVRCCNPSCGKWRALLRFMDATTVMEQCKNGEWYCVLNTWDEKAASCAAPQENLPAIGCPPWVMQNEDVA